MDLKSRTGRIKIEVLDSKIEVISSENKVTASEDITNKSPLELAQEYPNNTKPKKTNRRAKNT